MSPWPFFIACAFSAAMGYVLGRMDGWFAGWAGCKKAQKEIYGR